MSYQIFRVEEKHRSFIKARFLILKFSEILCEVAEDDPVIEVIEIDQTGFISSCFYGENELLYRFAVGHHFWKEAEGLKKAMALCEGELNREIVCRA